MKFFSWLRKPASRSQAPRRRIVPRLMVEQLEVRANPSAGGWEGAGIQMIISPYRHPTLEATTACVPAVAEFDLNIAARVNHSIYAC